MWLVGLFMVIVVVLFWHIASTPPGMSPAEKAAIASSSSLSAIWHWPLNAPHKLLQYVFQSFGHDSVGYMRAVSAAFGLLFSIAVYVLIKNWFGRFVAALSAMLLVGTPLFLILSRSATPIVMYLALLLPIGWFVALKHYKKWPLFNAVFLILIASAFYSPGVLWFGLIILLFWRKSLFAVLGRVSKPWLVGGGLMFALLLTPLVVALTDVNFLRQWLLLPQYLPGVTDILRNLGWAPVSFILRTDSGSQFLVGTTAILSLTQVVFMALGIAAMVRQAAREAIWLGTFAILGVLLYAANGWVPTLLIALPAVIVFAAAGMRYLYTEWKTIFPKNPIPHFVAVLLLSLVCFQQFVYGVHYTYKAWPHTVQTKKLYVLK